jgi:hypothetical protein
MSSPDDYIAPFTPEERKELWASFHNMVRVRHLILVELQTELDKKNTLNGCTPENISSRQGEVNGLHLAITLLKRKPSEL